MNNQLLESVGINHKKALERFLGDEDLYRVVLLSFLEEKSVERAKDALMDKDYENLFLEIHALKGLTGNLEISNLYSNSSKLCDILKSKIEPDHHLINELFSQIEADHTQVCNAIKQL